MKNQKLQIEQLESRIKLFHQAQKIPNPPTGWIKATRLALGVSLQQLAKKLSITKQSVREIEIREKEGAKTLKEVAKALDMELVYGFVPKDGTLDNYIEKKARAMAEKIVLRTSNTMKLEDQENSSQRIAKSIEERVLIIKQEMPKTLWD